MTLDSRWKYQLMMLWKFFSSGEHPCRRLLQGNFYFLEQFFLAAALGHDLFYIVLYFYSMYTLFSSSISQSFGTS